MWTNKVPEPKDDNYLWNVQIFSPDGEVNNIYVSVWKHCPNHMHPTRSNLPFNTNEMPFSGPKILAVGFNGEWYRSGRPLFKELNTEFFLKE